MEEARAARAVEEEMAETSRESTQVCMWMGGVCGAFSFPPPSFSSRAISGVCGAFTPTPTPPHPPSSSSRAIATIHPPTHPPQPSHANTERLRQCRAVLPEKGKEKNARARLFGQEVGEQQGW